PSVPLVARFRLSVAQKTGEPTNPVGHVDVYDATANVVLVDRAVNLRDIHERGVDQEVELEFVPGPGHLIELRIYWNGIVDLRLARVEVAPSSEAARELALFTIGAGLAAASRHDEAIALAGRL